MIKWRQHLFSARACNPQGRVDGFHILTDETETDYRFTKLILARDGLLEERRIAFIQDCGDYFYVGMDGEVPSVLGEKFPFAYENTISKNGLKKGREIAFVHGYFAPKGVRIPDLGELLEQQPKHLQEILERANAPAWESPVVMKGASFSRKRKPHTDWDRFATGFEHGNYPMKGFAFTIKGNVFYPLGLIKDDSVISATKSGSLSGKKLKWTSKMYEFFQSILSKQKQSHDEKK